MDNTAVREEAVRLVKKYKATMESLGVQGHGPCMSEEQGWSILSELIHKGKQGLDATADDEAGRAIRAPRTPTSGAEEARRNARNAAPTIDHRKDDESTSDFSELPPEDPNITRGMNTAIQNARTGQPEKGYWRKKTVSG